MYQPDRMIDTHQHLWLPSQRPYEWLDSAGPPLNADFGPEAVAADVAAAGITGTILVQAADTFSDTFYMLSVAAATPSIVGVVACRPRPGAPARAHTPHALTTGAAGAPASVRPSARRSGRRPRGPRGGRSAATG